MTDQERTAELEQLLAVAQAQREDASAGWAMARERISELEGEIGQEMECDAYSPTPWSFDGHGVNDANGVRIAKLQGEHWVTENGLLAYNRQRGEDGKLLARAYLVPELASTLRKAVHLLTHFQDGDLEDDDWLCVEDAIGAGRAMLAKAKGGNNDE